MKKWGVRLIGILFLLWAVSSFIDWLRGSEEGFLGFYINIFGSNISPLVEVFILLYTSYYIFKFDKRGRIWALILLWPSSIASLLFFIKTLVTYNSPIVVVKWTVGLEVFWLQGQEKTILDMPIRVLVVGLFMILSLAALYYLLRKDIKALFEPPTIPDITQIATDVKA